MTEKKNTLLVVDDEPVLRRVVKEAFDDCCEVLEASTGMEAIIMALKHLPDCILLDLMMPEMGGYVACEVLKQIRRTQLIPILVVSAKETEEDRKIAMESGAAGFVSKPFQLADLRSRVLDILANQPKERRQTPRLVLAVPVRIEGVSSSGEFCFHTLTEDISRKGLRFYGEFKAEVNDLIRVHLLSSSPEEGPMYAGKARVVWVDNRYAPLTRCGAEFAEVSPNWIVSGT